MVGVARTREHRRVRPLAARGRDHALGGRTEFTVTTKARACAAPHASQEFAPAGIAEIDAVAAPCASLTNSPLVSSATNGTFSAVSSRRDRLARRGHSRR